MAQWNNHYGGGSNNERLEVYSYDGRAIPRTSPGMEYLELPVLNPCQTYNDTIIDNNPTPMLRLRKYRCSIHMTYEALDDIFGITINRMERRSDNNESRLYFLSHCFSTICHSVNERLEREQPISEGHPIILESCGLVNHLESQLLLIDLTFWGTSMRDIDGIGKPLFERTIHEWTRLLRGIPNYPIEPRSYRGISPVDFERLSMEDIPYPYNGFTNRYNEDAEERAHELLKGMLTKKEFEIYKLEGFVNVKGTYGRMYNVKKGEMITVVQKRLGLKAKRYRLCIEPRDRGKICPTDEVIAKIKLIKASEKRLHKLANRFDDRNYTHGSGHLY